MSALPVLAVILPLIFAAIAMLFRPGPRRAHGLALSGAFLHLVLALMLMTRVVNDGIQVVQMGNWPAPFGISLVADSLGAMMVVIAALIGLAAIAYGRHDITADQVDRGFYPLMHILLAAICGAFLTGDLFNLYVWFEVMLMTSFGLLVLGQGRAQLDAGVKYVVINLVATLLFLTALGLVYGMTGTLNMADLHGKLSGAGNGGLRVAVLMLFLAAFGIKAGIFPLYFWLPAAYHTLPPSVAAVFAGLLTKVGVYALMRITTLVFAADAAVAKPVLLGLAVATMISGVLGAAAHRDVRRILSFHIISQVGYMVLGLALLTPLALAGAIFYLVHHIIVKANLFLVGGLMRQAGGSFDLAGLGGLYRRQPLLAALFFIPAFSLAGFPPLSGFWAKMILIRAGLEAGEILAVVATIGVGLLTVYSMTKIWAEGFWKEAEGDGSPKVPLSAWRLAPVAILAVLTVVIGLGAEPVYRLAAGAAEVLLTPELYVTAVLQGGAP
ncbi:MAG: Na+/H+ antiporter subunit D [Desulfobacterales bacterium]|jgi:multicomponent Na+:H+ antiporter subunit D|nr:Na+/H+ antiporter subunit D [Desulfobacteraceae bacterium]MDY0312703.1 Na+/H+ antiporter subunit D [Desulfobacterales bacterium]